MASNIPTYKTFRGEHTHFKDGEKYLYADYSNWTIENCEFGGVNPSTIKSRLAKSPFCQPHHLLPVKGYIERSLELRKEHGYNKEARKIFLTRSRLESSDEVLSQKWLCKKLCKKNAPIGF